MHRAGPVGLLTGVADGDLDGDLADEHVQDTAGYQPGPGQEPHGLAIGDPPASVLGVAAAPLTCCPGHQGRSFSWYSPSTAPEKRSYALVRLVARTFSAGFGPTANKGFPG